MKASYPYWTIRLVGGLMFFSGMLLMAYNVFKTVQSGKAYDAPIPAVSKDTHGAVGTLAPAHGD